MSIKIDRKKELKFLLYNFIERMFFFMAKQWNKDEKIEILEFSKQNGMRSSAEKYNVEKSTIQRWRAEAE